MFVLAIGLTAVAQTSLRGRVVDESTQSPIVGAKVTLANQDISTTTNASGEFSLLYLEAMDEDVIIEADGYVAGLELVNLQENQANELVIYDMSVNVWECCQDWNGSYSSSDQTNPQGPSLASGRVYRGGCWLIHARSCRVSSRGNWYPSSADFDIGLRLVL